MFYQNFISKIRYWDNITAKWLMRHFYFTFFQIVLVVIFLVWFVNMFKVVDVNYQVSNDSPILERIMTAQSLNIMILAFLAILNCFWILFVLSTTQRINSLLKDISYHLNRLSHKNK